ncbi:hypothetical protein V3481_017344 [Fusarium oxysporum f. sp. vasinfectum]
MILVSTDEHEFEGILESMRYQRVKSQRTGTEEYADDSDDEDTRDASTLALKQLEENDEGIGEEAVLLSTKR